MNTWLKGLTVFLVILYFFTFWSMFGTDCSSTNRMSCLKKIKDKILNSAPATTVEAPNEPGIFFTETTDRMIPPALVACSIESASRTYPDRPVYFLMKGLTNNESIYLNSDNTALLLLASFRNVRILPLSFGELVKDTPLQPWYRKMNPKKQILWTYNLSDSFREVVLWKFGGIYMDTDVISLRPVLVENFLVGENLEQCSSAVLGFQKHHPFLWDCMKDYVQNYDGNTWGQQGPLLFSRMSAKLCKMPDFTKGVDGMCQNITYFQPKRFYPQPHYTMMWYYGQWDKSKSLFDDSYGLHFWNRMNIEHREVTAGSNTVAEHIYMDYCPLTYLSLVKKKLS